MYHETLDIRLSTLRLLFLVFASVAVLEALSSAADKKPEELVPDSLPFLCVKYSGHKFGVAGIATTPSSDWIVLRASVEDRKFAAKLKWTDTHFEAVSEIARSSLASWFHEPRVKLVEDVGVLDTEVREALLRVLGPDRMEDLDFLALMLDGFIVLRRESFVAHLDLQKPQVEKINSLIARCWDDSVAAYAQNKYAEVNMSLDLEREWASHLTKASIRLNLKILQLLTEPQRETLLRDLNDHSALYEVARLVQYRAVDR